jgi:serine protease Do
MIRKKISFALVAALATCTAFAQTEKPKTENIIIKRGTDKQEKLTIVVDGDKITVNGKPVDEVNNANLKITRNVTARAPQPPNFRVFGQNMSGNKALLGVSTRETKNGGACIQTVSDASAAAKAGLKEGDIIIKLNDDEIKNPADLYNAVGKYKPEDKVKITYLRDGKEDKVKAVLGKADAQDFWKAENFKVEIPDIPEIPEMPELRELNNLPRGVAYTWSSKPKVGLQIEDLEEGSGVKVTDVNADAPAAKAGLLKDDVITAINGQEVKTVDELKEKMKSLKDGDSFTISFKRNNTVQIATVKLPKKVKKASL